MTPEQAAKLGAQAYRYGFPLLEFLRVWATETSVRCPDGAGNAPVNSFSNAPRFARPIDRTVVAPNVDTLYSIAHLDLGRGPVVLSHPAMGHRYFVFELVEPYTNVIGYIGTRTTGTGAGRFAITWTGHPGRRVPGARVIRSAYRRVWVIGRTLAGNRADQRRALALMRRYQLAPPGGPRRFARGCRPGKPVKAVTPTGLAFLDKLNAALAQNPPPSRDRAAAAPARRRGGRTGAERGPRRAVSGRPQRSDRRRHPGRGGTADAAAKLAVLQCGQAGPRLVRSPLDHRQLRHRLSVSGGDGQRRARRQHAARGDVSDRAHRRQRPALERQLQLPDRVPVAAKRRPSAPSGR